MMLILICVNYTFVFYYPQKKIVYAFGMHLYIDVSQLFHQIEEKKMPKYLYFCECKESFSFRLKKRITKTNGYWSRKVSFYKYTFEVTFPRIILIFL